MKLWSPVNVNTIFTWLSIGYTGCAFRIGIFLLKTPKIRSTTFLICECPRLNNSFFVLGLIASFLILVLQILQGINSNWISGKEILNIYILGTRKVILSQVISHSPIWCQTTCPKYLFSISYIVLSLWDLRAFRPCILKNIAVMGWSLPASEHIAEIHIKGISSKDILADVTILLWSWFVRGNDSRLMRKRVSLLCTKV